MMFIIKHKIGACAYCIDRCARRSAAYKKLCERKKLTATGLKFEYDRALALGFAIFVVMTIYQLACCVESFAFYGVFNAKLECTLLPNIRNGIKKFQTSGCGT